MKNVLMISIILLFANSAMATSNIQLAAVDVCKCLEEPNKIAAKVVEEIKHAQSSGDVAKIAKYQGEMMGVINASTKCFEKLPKKYPEIDKSQALKDKVMAVVEQECPNPAAQLTGS